MGYGLVIIFAGAKMPPRPLFSFDPHPRVNTLGCYIIAPSGLILALPLAFLYSGCA